MTTTPTLTARAAVVAGMPRPGALHRALRAAADALDRLVPPRVFARDAELLPEWFKYPPI
jgi:hypothetical protein